MVGVAMPVKSRHSCITRHVKHMECQEVFFLLDRFLYLMSHDSEAAIWGTDACIDDKRV